MDYIALYREERQKVKSSIQKYDSRHNDISNKALVDKTSRTSNPKDFNDSFSFEFQKVDLESFRVGNISNIYYIPDFLSDIEHDKILEFVDMEGQASETWKKLRLRKLQCWGGRPPNNVNDDFINEPLPLWLQSISEALVACNIFSTALTPNHVLINQYEANGGIFHHTDGPLYYNKVGIISLGSPTIMTFRPRIKTEDIGNIISTDVASVLLLPKSLLVFSDDVYDNYMHGIECSDNPIVTIGQPVECINLKFIENHNLKEGDQVRLLLD